MSRSKRNYLEPLVLILISVVITAPAACDKSTDEREEWTYTVPEETGDGWQTDSAQSAAINMDVLNDMMTYIRRDRHFHNIHSILIVRHNRLVFEEYFTGYDYTFDPANNNRGDLLFFDRDTPHCMHSTAKSFTSALIGIAIDKGFIPGDREKMFAFYEDSSRVKTDQKDRILLEHLLSNTSGLSWNENDVPLEDGDNDLLLLWRSADPIGFIIGKPMVADPGTLFNYSGGNTNLLGEIVHRSSGMRVPDFSRRYLFAPLGITDFRWLSLQNDITYTSGDLYITPRSMAKFGQLFLNKGTWNGVRILSEDWVERSTAFYISPSLPESYLRWSNGYGYCWWMNDHWVNGSQVHSYFTSGWGGQAIYIIPRLDTVVVFTAGNYWNTPGMEKVQFFLETYILKAIL